MIGDIQEKQISFSSNIRQLFFVNGYFGHQHDCSKFVWPSSNEDYWIPKIQKNVERDCRNKEMLINMGWNVLVAWECQLKKKSFKETMNLLVEGITKGIGIDE